MRTWENPFYLNPRWRRFRMTKTYWKITPKARFEAWKKYNVLVDREVKRLETAYKKETDPKLKEECRNVLNEMYQTQYQLEHTLH